MRAREFINEQVAAALPMAGTAVKGAVSGVKNAVTKGAGTALDQYYNAMGYAKGAGMDLPDPVGAAVNKVTGTAPEPVSNKPYTANQFVKDQAAWNLSGQALQKGAQIASKLPVVAKAAPALGWLGTAARTGTGPVGTAVSLGLRSGDAGRAYGPHADTIDGRNQWMTKHGYDPAKPGEAERAMKDYNQAKANWDKQPVLSKLNQKLNPFATDDTEDDDAIMQYKNK